MRRDRPARPPAARRAGALRAVLPSLAACALVTRGLPARDGDRPRQARARRRRRPALPPDRPDAARPAGPVAVQMLRLDPSRVDLRSALAQDRVMQLETVPDIAARAKAIAAVNAGLLRRQERRSGGRARGGRRTGQRHPAHAGRRRHRARARQAARARLRSRERLGRRCGSSRRARTFAQPIDGIDTTRVRGKLMLYTPRFGPDSDMADTGVEWQLGGIAAHASIEQAAQRGHARPSRATAWCSPLAARSCPTALERLDRGQAVIIDATFQTLLGTLPEQWTEAQDIVGGAGLLVLHGRPMTDWTDEQLRAGFNTERHPRTMIGTATRRRDLARHGRRPQPGGQRRHDVRRTADASRGSSTCSTRSTSTAADRRRWW